ncbi:NUDIX hydrolase [Cognatilysobacter terrigena]|uniref:NUDIX hydrolase n=1 Tax=Cognatilysobacter terrigena TaxID=2488749 RepID=UPI001060A2D2|nr:NUDIX hydrolase [Lysobacter terrigena]
MTPDHDAPLETLYEGRWLRLVKRGRWDYAERVHGHGMAVIIVAATPDDEVLFVEQYRVPLGKSTIEMPAGLVGDVDDDDTLLGAARRELIEETGWDAAHLEVLLVGPTTAGMSSERIAFVRARDLTRVGEGGGVGDEGIVVHQIPRRDAPAWLMRKHAEGFEVDLKLWGGLWMLEREPDGTPLAPSRAADDTAA